MDLFKNLKNVKRFFTQNNVIAFLAFIFVVYAISQYSRNIGSIVDTMDSNGNGNGDS